MLKVGYLGPKGKTFGYEAANKFLSAFNLVGRCKPHPLRTHEDIFDAVLRKEVAYGVLAIENALVGFVDETARVVVDHFRNFLHSSDALSEVSAHASLLGMVRIPVELYLQNRKGTLDGVTRIASHPNAIAQCRKTVNVIKRRYPNIEELPLTSTGAGADRARGEETTVAIASLKTGDKCGLIKVKEFETRADDCGPGISNETRFWIFGSAPLDGNRNKTAILLDLNREEPGVLAKALALLSDEHINLAVIYPNPRPDANWEYTFIVEVEADQGDGRIKNAIESLRDQNICKCPLVLGGYYEERPVATRFQ